MSTNDMIKAQYAERAAADRGQHEARLIGRVGRGGMQERRVPAEDFSRAPVSSTTRTGTPRTSAPASIRISRRRARSARCQTSRNHGCSCDRRSGSDATRGPPLRASAITCGPGCRHRRGAPGRGRPPARRGECRGQGPAPSADEPGHLPQPAAAAPAPRACLLPDRCCRTRPRPAAPAPASSAPRLTCPPRAAPGPGSVVSAPRHADIRPATPG